MISKYLKIPFLAVIRKITSAFLIFGKIEKYRITKFIKINIMWHKNLNYIVHVFSI
jgi:hypothetical protein